MWCCVIIFTIFEMSSAGLNTAPFAKRKNRHLAQQTSNSILDKRPEDVSSLHVLESTGPNDHSLIGCYEHESDLTYLELLPTVSDHEFTFLESAHIVANIILIAFILVSVGVRLFCCAKSSKQRIFGDHLLLDKFGLLYVSSHQVDPRNPVLLATTDERKCKPSSVSAKEVKASSKSSVKVSSSKGAVNTARKKDVDADKIPEKTKEKSRQNNRSSERVVSTLRKVTCEKSQR